MTDKPRYENDKFISEPIEPNRDTFDTSRMASCEPGMPHEFTWRNDKYDVAEVLETWKSTGKCHSGSDEKYVRRHWFRIRTQSGEAMTIYCSRQPAKRDKKTGTNWVLYSMEEKKS